MGIGYLFTEIAVTSVLFLTLFGFVAILMNSTMAHTDEMLSGFYAYSDDPTDANQAHLEASINDADAYMKQMSSMSSAQLKNYLDSIDLSILSEEDKKSLEQAKELLDSVETEEITDPEVMEMQNKLNRIFERLGEIESHE